MTQIINLIGYFSTFFLLMDAKQISNPSGSENINVNVNNLRVSKKPSSNDNVTDPNIFYHPIVLQVTLVRRNL